MNTERLTCGIATAKKRQRIKNRNDGEKTKIKIRTYEI